MTLSEYIIDNTSRAFKWGEHDCVLFATGWIKHKTGIDYVADIPKWSTAKQGLRIVKEMGGMKNIVDTRLKPVHPNFAKDGDIALYKNSLTIFSGNHIVGPGKNGLVHINRMEAECAWSIS